MVGKKEKKSTLPRPPVVTIMGHIDHGKTTLLDRIRRTNVVAQEFGGITQHIGAYQVEVPLGKEKRKITFIDTPGHEAFVKMRARGAQVTDIVVLVVAADDGVMPQTKEAIEHAKAANVPLIVAINKIDLETANPAQVKEQLVKVGVVPEEFGGDVPVVEISAKEGKGIEDLLEMILLLAELKNLQADFQKPFKGTIIESFLDRRKGPVVTILVQEGTLKVRDEVYWDGKKEKIRALFDDRGKALKTASPSTPVEVLGFSNIPPVGTIVSGEKREEKKEISAKKKIKREKSFNLILRADTEGTKETILDSLKDYEKVEVILAGTGDITESDVFLAKTSNAQILGFNIRVPPSVQRLAEAEKVQIKTYKLIYHLLEDLEKGIEEVFKVKEKEILGKGEIIAQFQGTKARIAGVKVLFGRFKIGEKIQILREGEVVGETQIATMRHLKEDIKVAKEGEECGMTFSPPLDFRIKDVIECYRAENGEPEGK